MSSTPTHIGAWRDPDIARIGNAHGSRPVLVAKSGVAATRFHVFEASQTAGLALNTVRVLKGRRMTVVNAATVAPTDTGATAYTTGSITRSAGSFIAEGWKVGDRLIATGSTTLANDTETIVTAVTALTLTVTAASFTAEALPNNAELYKAGQSYVATIDASAGSAAGTPLRNLLDPALLPSLDDKPDRQLILGPRGALFLAVGTPIAAGAANWLDAIAQGGDY